MDAFKARAVPRVVAGGLAAASLAPLLWIGAAQAQPRVIGPEFALRGSVPTRVLTAARRPTHIPVEGLRTGLGGGTPESSKYWKLTNITGELHVAHTGSAVAVNNDGRIAYNDRGNGSDQGPEPYIVADNGDWFILPYPSPESGCVGTNYSALALNESEEAVGTWGCGDDTFYFQGYSAWSLTSALKGTVAYYDQRYSYYPDGSYEASVNDHNVAVGCDGGCLETGNSGGAAVFEPAKSSKGHLQELRGLKGKTCYSTATGINDAGEIVGFACNEAVRFSLTGDAEPLFSSKLSSSAEAINQHGDVAGYFSNGTAFLFKAGKITTLPLPAGDKGSNAYAYAINSTDEVVGTLSGSHSSAFAYIDGHSYDLNSLIAPNSGWKIVDAFGVNDHGEIVGDGYFHGTLYGFSLKPPT